MKLKFVFVNTVLFYLLLPSHVPQNCITRKSHRP